VEGVGGQLVSGADPCYAGKIQGIPSVSGPLERIWSEIPQRFHNRSFEFPAIRNREFFSTSREIAAGEYRLQSGTDIRTIQKLLDHADIRTTLLYTHGLDNTRRGVESPADRLALIRSTANSDQTGEKKPAP
jgi:hypothetical protein